MDYDKTTKRYFEPTYLKIVGGDGKSSYVQIDNQAVAKMAEEQLGGLAAEEELIPDNKRDGRGKTFLGGAFRNPLTNFDAGFYLRHEKAIEEIWIVHQKNTGALNYGSLIASMESRGGKTYQEAVAAYTDMENRYNEWYATCKLKARTASINVFGRGMNFKWAAMDMGIDRGKIKPLCEIGIKTYERVRHGRG